MAAQSNTTPARKPDVPYATPNILALGMVLAATDGEHERHDKARARRQGKGDPPGLNDYLDMLSFRSEALRDLISTLPAKSLADAAVQLEVATSFACGLEASDVIENASYRVRMEIAALERLVYSALPLVAEAAELDLDAIGWGWSLRLRASKFTGSTEL